MAKSRKYNNLNRTYNNLNRTQISDWVDALLMQRQSIVAEGLDPSVIDETITQLLGPEGVKKSGILTKVPDFGQRPRQTPIAEMPVPASPVRQVEVPSFTRPDRQAFDMQMAEKNRQAKAAFREALSRKGRVDEAISDVNLSKFSFSGPSAEEIARVDAGRSFAPTLPKYQEPPPVPARKIPPVMARGIPDPPLPVARELPVMARAIPQARPVSPQAMAALLAAQAAPAASPVSNKALQEAMDNYLGGGKGGKGLVGKKGVLGSLRGMNLGTALGILGTGATALWALPGVLDLFNVGPEAKQRRFEAEERRKDRIAQGILMGEESAKSNRRDALARDAQTQQAQLMQLAMENAARQQMFNSIANRGGQIEQGNDQAMGLSLSQIERYTAQDPMLEAGLL